MLIALVTAGVPRSWHTHTHTYISPAAVVVALVYPRYTVKTFYIEVCAAGHPCTTYTHGERDSNPYIEIPPSPTLYTGPVIVEC